MAAPFEDEVIQFIGSRRPLKLAFLAVTVVGILGSAYSTLHPLFEKLQPFTYRALGVELPKDIKQRYSCAYFSGSAQWDLPNSTKVAESQGIVRVTTTLANFQEKLLACQNALGYSPPPIPPALDVAPNEVPHIQTALISNLSAFSGALQSKDRLTYLLYQIGSDTAMAITQLAPSDPEELRDSVTTSLIPLEAEVANRISDSLEEASGICPCKLPRIAVRSNSRQEFLRSARELDAAMSNYLAPLPPARTH
ncbi:hypothetical protein [Rhodoferax sp. WC2427]|uniref:hypothetical protein n=1 Tax=Rhodoferax sp. WC2427 TaxID=3234144 RepID=UPI00346622A5